MPALPVEVWSDVACPWCFIGKRRLDAAIAALPAGSAVEVRYRSFELDPRARSASRPRTSYAERLARKYRASLEEAQRMIDRVTALGEAEGITFRLDRVRPANTFEAHRVLQLARVRGVQAAVKDRLLRAYFTEGEFLGDPEVLVRLAVEAGLGGAEVRRALAGDRHAADVRADEEEAARNGIHAVPFFLLAGEFAVSGAQPVEILHGALAQALDGGGPGA